MSTIIRLIRLNHLPMSRRCSHMTHTTQPSTDESQMQSYDSYDSTTYRRVEDTAIRLIRLNHRPMSCRNTHTTRKEAEHIRRASRLSSSSLSIERSERFPDCLLEIPLATPWPKQTLRLATRTYSPPNNYLPTPHRLQPIYYSCVCAITSTALHPPSLTQPHLHRRPSPCGPGHIETLVRFRGLDRQKDKIQAQ